MISYQVLHVDPPVPILLFMLRGVDIYHVAIILSVNDKEEGMPNSRFIIVRIHILGIHNNCEFQMWFFLYSMLYICVVLNPIYAVPFIVSGSCSLGPDTLQKAQDKIALVSGTLHGRLKVLLAEIVFD